MDGALKGYARRLPRLRVKDYGGSSAYAPAQIRAAIRRHGLNPRYENYAVAMFSDRERFEQFRAERGESRDYDEMRGHAALSSFGDAADFAALNFLSDSGFADGGASGAESSDFSGHHGQ